MDDYLEVTLDIFDKPGQRAAILASTTVAAVIAEVLAEFTDLQAAGPERYGLSLADTGQPLAFQKSLAEQGVQNGDRLVFGWVGQPAREARRPVAGPGRARLLHEASGREYPITWQPARIGRPSADLTHNAQLLVDVQWLPEGGRVSRRHADITEQGGVFYLEALSDQNPTLLNGQPLQPEQPAGLRSGDRIGLGASGIVLTFVERS
jgi:hypothetical protein